MSYSQFSAAACLVLLPATLFAQTTQRLHISDATVFLSGAELTSSARLNLSKGENEIVFTNVAGDINSESLAISATNGVVVASAESKNNYLADEVVSPRAQQIKDSIEILSHDTMLVHNKITVLKHEAGVIWKNSQVSGQNSGLNVAELSKYLDLVNSKMEGYMNQQVHEEEGMKKLTERLVRLSRQLTEEQARGYQPGGQLLVKFYATEATASDITVSYVVPHAGWSPSYDVCATDAASPVKLYYKAQIYQNSGVKWDNVHLTLSTGNPVEGAQAPALSPWYLYIYQPATQYDRVASAATYQAGRGAAMKVGGAHAEAEVNEQQSGIDDYVTVDNAGINTSFDIDLPYSIPCDGQHHLVAIKSFELPATYRYFAVPRLDKDVFLQAQITKWEDLNLLPGPSNIFYEGAYVGKGTIDVRNLQDTMNISLGRDKKIIVKRERDMKLRTVKYFGMNVRETFDYTISVRNTRRQPITLIIQDQLPVSNDNEIVVEDISTNGAAFNELTGMLQWSYTIGSNETKTTGLGYTVRYPRGKTVAGL